MKKNYTVYKDIYELGKFLKVPTPQIDKIQMRTSLSTAIRRAIEKKKLTHAEAAKKAGVGRTVITAVMNGNVLHISTDRLIDIAGGLGLTITMKIAS